VSRRWSVLVVETPEGLEEEVAAALADSGLGAEIAPAAPGVAEVRVYLEEAADREGWTARARSVLAAHGAPARGIRIESLEDRRWVEAYRATLRPIPLGRRFVVLPGEGFDVPAGREAIQLVPGMAFGTGEHPTTRMCAEALERAVDPGSRWLDLGTGTGLLALLAVRCGAAAVLAVDTDPEAVRVARETVAGNRGGDRVEVVLGSTEARGEERFDGIVANIAASFFLREAPALAACLRPGGVLLATGFLIEDLEEIGPALARAAFRIVARTEIAPWALVEARREER
jgi:ribosomal protein L11 methyltransferase